jgi:dehydrogenase/reductase SDR family member 12
MRSGAATGRPIRRLMRWPVRPYWSPARIPAGLAALGARVIMVVRNTERGAAARAEIAAPPDRLVLERCDISDLRDVADLVGRVSAQYPVIHAVVHGAGVMPRQRETSAQHHEMCLATHVLGPHSLTAGLAEALIGGRVIWVSSGGMYAQRMPSDDWEFERDRYRPLTAYARTKRMQVVLAEMWAEHLRNRVVVHSMHPGWANTAGVSASMPRFYAITKPLLRTPEQGADTIVWLAAAGAPGQNTGLFWHDRAPRPTHRLAKTRETTAERNALWEFCERAR